MMDCSQLHHFHPYRTGLERDVQALLARTRRERQSCGREAFLALLAGVPALRKVPGLPGPRESGANYFTTLPRCASEADAVLCRNHMKAVFGITDKKSLLAFCDEHIRCQSNYLDFEGFWEGRPLFDPAPLLREGFFAAARDFSAQFYPLVGRQGYLAWDISECMGHLRLGLACGLLSQEEFDSLADEWAAQAQIFGSWEEYAASLVCGALYWDFRQGTQLPELQRSQRLWMDQVRALLANDAAWDSGLWYVPPRDKEYCLWPSEFRLYLTNWEGPSSCFITDAVSVEGKKIGWCYREKPETDFPEDSGWRFFSGDETDEYINDPKNSSLAELNSACCFDPDILPLLTSPYGSAFARSEDGKFYPYVPED
ncbi:MAG: DUF2185 domain-containing protein [Oscillibacter sp.]|nr:DUF2185 domain-containing protein [Oscillibacter sp.]